jgi:hypothetical protein
MESVTGVIETTAIREKRINTEKPVTICRVSYGGKERMGEKANIDYETSGTFMVRFCGERTHVMVVQSFKKGALPQDSGEITDNTKSLRKGKDHHKEAE